MNLDSLRLGIRYSDTGIAKRSYLTLYIITRRLSMRLWSSGRQCRFSSIFDHSILYVSAAVCGDQTVEAYPNCGIGYPAPEPLTKITE